MCIKLPNGSCSKQIGIIGHWKQFIWGERLLTITATVHSMLTEIVELMAVFDFLLSQINFFTLFVFALSLVECKQQCSKTVLLSIRHSPDPFLVCKRKLPWKNKVCPIFANIIKNALVIRTSRKQALWSISRVYLKVHSKCAFGINHRLIRKKNYFSKVRTLAHWVKMLAAVLINVHFACIQTVYLYQSQNVLWWIECQWQTINCHTCSPIPAATRLLSRVQKSAPRHFLMVEANTRFLGASAVFRI